MKKRRIKTPITKQIEAVNLFGPRLEKGAHLKSKAIVTDEDS
jgi:hypothetical protein